MNRPARYIEFDQLLVADQRTGQPAMGFGLQARLFLDRGDRRETRHAVVEAMARFHRLSTRRITHMQPGAAVELRPIAAVDFPAACHALVEQIDPATEAYSPHLTSLPVAPPKWQAVAELPAGSEGADAISTFDAAVPLSFLATGDEAYLAALLDWCAILRPMHGLAGIAPVHEFGSDRSRRGMAWPYLARFPGLNCLLPYPVAAKGRGGRNISGINWLTILGDGILARLGGREALAGRLAAAWAGVMERPGPEGMPPGISVLDYPGGIVLRAGPEPQPGDVNMGDIPKAYRVVNDALQALRFDDYQQNPMDLIEVPRPLDAYEETLNWLHRFDLQD